MVKKLLKHELNYYFRSFWLFLPIVLVIGVMTRVFRLFEGGTIFTEIAIFSSIGMLWVACMALLLLSSVVCIVRFYKNMYTAEGYLTFTLPLTGAQHIFVKLLSSLICQAICLFTVILSLIIAFSGEALSSFFEPIGDLFGEIFVSAGAVNLIFYAIELLFMIVLAAASTLLLYYACITIGQLAKKNRILLAIGTYFIYYVATQVLSTIFTIVFALISVTPFLGAIFEWIALNPFPALHIYFWIMILFSAALSAAFWLVTQWIMTKKLNLE